jgi:hypothetical protein
MIAVRLPEGRRRTRRRMTLIAAYRTVQGIAICADSQETVGDHRQTVNKISPVTIGDSQIIIAGSGNATLIDSFVICAQSALLAAEGTLDLAGALQLLKRALREFYKEDVAAYPFARREPREIKLFIGIGMPRSKEFNVFVSEHMRLRPLKDFELIGWDETIYWVTAHRMYRRGMSLQRGVLAALSVLLIGQESSNYVKGPFTVATVNEYGIHVDELEFIAELGERLKAIERLTSTILLAATDSSVYSYVLKDLLDSFSSEIVELHKGYVESAIRQPKRGSAAAMHRVPPGILVETLPDGSKRVRHDINGIEELCRRINEGIESSRQGDGEPALKPSTSDRSEDQQ